MVLTSSWIAGLLRGGFALRTNATYSIGSRPAIAPSSATRAPSGPKTRRLKSPNAKPTNGPSHGLKRPGGEAGRRGFYLDASARGIHSGRFGFAFRDFSLRLPPFGCFCPDLPTNSATEPNFPTDLAADNAGNIYGADTQNATVRKITPIGIVTKACPKSAHFATGDRLST